MSDDPRDDVFRDAAAGTPGLDPRTSGPEAERVRDFFAEERRAAGAFEADPLRWKGILETAGRRRRSHLRHTAWAAAAAVVLVAVGVATLGRGNPGAQAPAGPVASPSVVGPRTPSPTPFHSSGSGPTPSTSSTVPARVGTPVPASFAVRSLTTGAPGHLFALGTVSCPGGQCPALAGSSDNGAGWSLVHTFPASTAVTGTGPGRPGGTGALTQVRFASATVGWVFGGAALRTSDGGVTWQDYPHPGGSVIGLETDGNDVVLTTAPRCSGGTCHGAISVLRAPVTATSALDVVGTIDGGAGVQDAPIGWQGGRAFVSPVVVPGPSQPAPAPVVVAANGLHRAAPTSCGIGQSVRLVTAASGTTMFALCLSGGAAGHLGYAVQASSDGGASWHPVPGQPLLLANAGVTSFAAADARNLIAVSGGSPDLHGSMMLSSDGGASWRQPRSAPPLPDLGWVWVGAPGGATFYALSGDGTGTYWKSSDRGETWSQVPVAGH